MDWDWNEDPGPQIHICEAETFYWSPAVFRGGAAGSWDTTWGFDLAYAVKHDTSLSYLFYDGFESGNLDLWSGSVP